MANIILVVHITNFRDIIIFPENSSLEEDPFYINLETKVIGVKPGLIGNNVPGSISTLKYKGKSIEMAMYQYDSLGLIRGDSIDLLPEKVSRIDISHWDFPGLIKEEVTYVLNPDIYRETIETIKRCIGESRVEVTIDLKGDGILDEDSINNKVQSIIGRDNYPDSLVDLEEHLNPAYKFIWELGAKREGLPEEGTVKEITEAVDNILLDWEDFDMSLEDIEEFISLVYSEHH